MQHLFTLCRTLGVLGSNGPRKLTRHWGNHHTWASVRPRMMSHSVTCPRRRSRSLSSVPKQPGKLKTNNLKTTFPTLKLNTASLLFLCRNPAHLQPRTQHGRDQQQAAGAHYWNLLRQSTAQFCIGMTTQMLVKLSTKTAHKYSNTIQKQWTCSYSMQAVT